MIVKSIFTKNSATGWLGYITYHSMKSEFLDGRYRGLFNQLGKRATANEIKSMVDLSEVSGITRMIIFAPARWIPPQYLSEYTVKTMWEYIQKDARHSIRFMYSLHYNTDHPHSHVVMTAYYTEDVLMRTREIVLIKDIAKQIFNEPIGVPKKIIERAKGNKEKEERLEVIIRKTNWIESMIEKEEKEIRKFKGVKSVDDVIKMNEGLGL